MKNFFIILISLLFIFNPSINLTNEQLQEYETITYQNDGYSSDISIQAISNYQHTYDNYLEAYYWGLTENFAHNANNSCGYVALAMILSYYDTFLNDNIIPDSYDVASTGNSYIMTDRNNSPGISYDYFTANQKSTTQNFYNTLEDIQDESLYAKLLLIGYELGYWDLNTSVDNLGVTDYTERASIMQEYFDDVGYDNYSISRISNITASESEIIDFVKSNIDSGYPVLISTAGNPLGHAWVCYDYNNNNLYGHFGLKNYTNYTHYMVTGTIRNAMVLKFNNEPHTHTDNYEVTTSHGTDKFCYCNSNILTYTSIWTKFDEQANFNGHLTIPYWVTGIGQNVFSNNTTVRTVEFENNSQLNTIDDFAFSNCSNLTAITFPSSLNTIGNSAFNNCTNLSTVTFTNNSTLKTIEAYAFMGCTKLQTITIPNTVTTIGWSPFISCNVMNIYTEISNKPSGWDTTWNVADIDYDTMLSDMMNGIYRDESYYYTYHIVHWGN